MSGCGSEVVKITYGNTETSPASLKITLKVNYTQFD